MGRKNLHWCFERSSPVHILYDNDNNNNDNNGNDNDSNLEVLTVFFVLIQILLNFCNVLNNVKYFLIWPSL